MFTLAEGYVVCHENSMNSLPEIQKLLFGCKDKILIFIQNHLAGRGTEALIYSVAWRQRLWNRTNGCGIALMKF